MWVLPKSELGSSGDSGGQIQGLPAWLSVLPSKSTEPKRLDWRLAFPSVNEAVLPGMMHA